MSIPSKNYYKILNLDDNASEFEIKKAYKKLAYKYHPDISKNIKLEEKFKNILEAYDTLKNKESKRKYDHSICKLNNSHKYDINLNNSLYSEYRSNKKNDNSITNSSIKLNFQITLEEACLGASKIILIKNKNITIKKLTVKIPKGVIEGNIIKLIKGGNDIINFRNNVDLLLKLKIKKHKIFKVINNDLQMLLKLSLWEAILGTYVEINTLYEKIKIKIPECCNSDTTLKIKGKGLQMRNKKNSDLIIKMKIIFPKKLTDKEKELLEKIRHI